MCLRCITRIFYALTFEVSEKQNKAIRSIPGSYLLRTPSYLLRYFHPPIEEKQERIGYGSEEFLTKITHLIPPVSRASLPDNFSVSNSF